MAVSVLLLAVSAPAQVAGPDQMKKGANFVRVSSSYAYNSQSSYQSLEKLRDSVGANWIAVCPVWFQSDTGSSTVYFLQDSSPTPAEVSDLIYEAHEQGLRVMLKPEVRCVSGTWIGHHDPHSGQWYDSYWSFIKLYATIAQQTGCELFCVGTALDSSANEAWETQRWQQLVSLTKGRYLGPVTYAADWRSYRSIGFWDSLDMVGINAYFPMDPDSVPEYGDPEPAAGTVDYYAWVWDHRWVPDIESFRRNYLADTTKPVIFTEVGYRSVEGSPLEPWNRSITGDYAPTAQRNCYIAALHSLLGEPWFAGWFWTEWTTDPSQGGPYDLSYSPKGKPAQEVLRRWNASIASQRGAEVPCFDRHRYGWTRTLLALQSLADNHANWAALVGLWEANALDSAFTTIEPCSSHTPTDTSLQQAIHTAHQAGLNVMLKAQPCGPHAAWQGQFDPTSYGVRDAWFREFKECVVHYAEMAEAESCEMLCAGVELDPTTDQPAEAALWRDSVIAAVRQVYSGPVVYAALWPILDGAPTKPLIWEAVDFAGIDAYFRLYPDEEYAQGGWAVAETSGQQDPSVEDLAEYSYLSWQDKWLPRLESFRDTVERPVIFPEIGYRSIDSTAWYTAHDQRYGWRQQTSNTSADLFSVCFPLDTLTGYAVGTARHVLKTTDGGGMWDPPSCAAVPDTLHCVHFHSSKTRGFVCGADGDGIGALLYTTDGGVSWSEPEIANAPDPLPPLRSVSFGQDSTVGVAVGFDGLILRTTDCGETWDTARSAVQADLYGVHFPSPETGFAVGGGGTVLRTTDAGGSWTSCASSTDFDLYAVDFASATWGLAVGDTGTVLYTTNGGETWQDSMYRNGPFDLLAVSIADSLSGRYMGGSKGARLRAGRNWPLAGACQTGGDHAIRDIQFRAVNLGPERVEHVGYAVGDAGTVLKASTGGRMLVDFREQANCYEAAFRAFWGDSTDPVALPWFYGFHWWMWEPDHEPMSIAHEEAVDMYTPQQKPAGDILHDWFDWPASLPQQGQAWLRHFPTGELDVVTTDNDRSNVPLVLFRLESHDWDQDPSGETPADYALLIQEYYGTGQALQNADSTEWFSFTADTSWQFLHGQGSYRFYVRYKDNLNHISPRYYDFEDTVVVFDTTP